MRHVKVFSYVYVVHMCPPIEMIHSIVYNTNIYYNIITAICSVPREKNTYQLQLLNDLDIFQIWINNPFFLFNYNLYFIEKASIYMCVYLYI